MTKLILYEKCWDAIINLPKSIQKKIPEFMAKFRENSRSSAIHLEPISTFRDPSLRTARIDLNYRAIIRVPESGDNYFLLWVDKHDEAMDWAKNKMFQWNVEMQSYQVYTETPLIGDDAPPRSTTVPAGIQQIVASPSLGERYPSDQLKAIGVPEALLEPVLQIRSLEDLDRMHDALPSDAFENLFYLLDGMDIRDVLADVRDGRSASPDQAKQEGSLNNRRNFFVLEDDEALTQILDGTLQKWRIFLHPSQRLLVEGDFPGTMKVTGAAGTGKTVAAMHRLKFLAEKDPSPNQPILFCTYTKALTDNLRHQIKGLGVEDRLYKVIHVDALVRELAERAGLIDARTRILDYPGVKSSVALWEELMETEIGPYDPEFLQEEYQQVILMQDLRTPEAYYEASRIGRQRKIGRKDRMAIWALAEAYKALQAKQRMVSREALFNDVAHHFRNTENKPFRHVIADELQDFSNIELRFLRSLVEKKPNDLFLVGDPMQSIYAKQLNFSRCGILVQGKRSRRLKVNYRTTEEIRRAAISVVAGISYDDFEGEEETKKGYVSLANGKRPDYQTFRTEGEQSTRILELLRERRESGMSWSDLCIACRTKDQLREVKKVLHNQGIPYVDLSASGQVTDGEGVVLSTMHGMKGLEFRSVFLPYVQRTTIPYIPSGYAIWPASRQREYDKSERSLLYVAMTRAREELFLLGVGDQSTLVRLGEPVGQA